MILGRRPSPTILLGILLLGLLGAGAIAARAAPGGPAAWVEAGVRAIHGLGPAGVAAFATAQVLVAFSGILPASLVGMAAGAVYGIPLGFALASISTMAGAWLAFRASRSLLRSRIERTLARRPRLRSLDTALAGDSWRLVCLLRVSPVMPFAVTSYMLGLSSVPERDYLLGTLAAMPALLGYVCLGGFARAGVAAGVAGAGAVHWAMLAAGLAATLVLTVRIGQMLVRVAGLDRDGQPLDAGPDVSAPSNLVG